MRRTPIACESLGCAEVRHDRFAAPLGVSSPDKVTIVLISETAPAEPGEYYYSPGAPLFARTTIQAFNDAGFAVRTLQDIRKLGVYLTTAVKCAKTGYAVPTAAIRECSHLLEKELAGFPKTRVILAMGDVAIRSINEIARRNGDGRVVPAGSTYKIRGGEFTWRGVRVFPSYLQAGPSFFIEKTKRQMIAEDIAAAVALVRGA